MAEFIAEDEFGGGAAEACREEFLVEIGTGEEVKGGAFVLDDVIAAAATENEAEIKLLELVEFEVGEGEDESLFADVEAVAAAAADGVGGGGLYVFDAGIRVDTQEVEGDLVAGGVAGGVGAQVEGVGFGIATGGGVAGVEEAGPEVREAGVGVAIETGEVAGLFVLRTDGGDFLFGGFDLAGVFGGDGVEIGFGFEGANDGLAVFQDEAEGWPESTLAMEAKGIFTTPARSDFRVSASASTLTTAPVRRSPFFMVTESAKAREQMNKTEK